MNTLQRLASNALLSFIANLIIKGSDTLLFIGLGRLLGPDTAGEFTLGKTFFSITFTISAWGLHELLVREVAPKREESGLYFINYLFVRVLITAVTYLLFLLTLSQLLPYSPETKSIIGIMTLAVFPETIFSLCQALFVAHEKMKVPALAASVNGILKLGLGGWFLLNGASVQTIAWVIPIGSSISTLVYLPAIINLFRQASIPIPTRINLNFIFQQLRYTPGFIAIGFFYILDFQTDTFLISLYLTKSDIGWYGAAQTIMLGFWILSIAIRTALYPLMTRYQLESSSLFEELYRKSIKYLIIIIFPIVAGIILLAEPIIKIIFKSEFLPAVPALQWSMGAVIFAFLNVPYIIIMLIYNRQRYTAQISGISMVVNIILNIILLPFWGIAGSAIARTAATFILFFLVYLYVERQIIKGDLLVSMGRPTLAVLFMSFVVWYLRDLPLPIPIIVGALVYTIAVFILGAFSEEDQRYLRLFTKTPK
jgi:O-antigen/teichoic acid export membrane protein